MLPRGGRIICMIQDRFSGLDLYRTDLAQHLITAGQDLLDHNLDRYLSVGRVVDLTQLFWCICYERMRVST